MNGLQNLPSCRSELLGAVCFLLSQGVILCCIARCEAPFLRWNQLLWLLVGVAGGSVVENFSSESMRLVDAALPVYTGRCDTSTEAGGACCTRLCERARGI